MPASHALARLAAAMATPPAEDVAAAAAEGTSEEELAMAAAMAVPPALSSALLELLADKVLEVRVSALHAIKTMCKLRPALLRASSSSLSARAMPAIVQGCQDKRHQPLMSAAQRTLMHVLAVNGWEECTEPPAALRADREAAQYVVDYARKSYKRLAALESEAEHSDEDPI